MPYYAIACWVVGLLASVACAHAAPVQRVVSLAPHATELIAAAGGASRLVAITQACDAPEGIEHLPRIAGAHGVNLEKLVALKPDLVVAWPGGNRPQDLERIRALGMPLLLTEPKNVDDIARDIERLGEALGTQAIAAAASARIKRELAAIKATVAPVTRPRRVFYQLGAGALFTLNDAHPVMQLLAACGGQNVFGSLPMLAPQVAVEAVVEAKPDVIMVASPRELAQVTRFWEQRRAAFHGRPPAIIAVDGERLHRPTPRLLPAARAMCEALHAAPPRERAQP